MTLRKKKIGIIVQRYGGQINGGSEALAKMLAEKLNEKYKVTVFTSRAIDYHNWEPVLKKGVAYENGVKIIRFDHGPRRYDLTPDDVHRENRKARGRLLYQKVYRALGRPQWFLNRFPDAGRLGPDPKKWLELLGPYTKRLVPRLMRNRHKFSAYIFFTYLYYPSSVGMPAVASKSIFIPTMHDEPSAHQPGISEVMTAPAFIFFLTEEEKKFSEEKFNISHIPSKVISVGIDVPAVNPDVSVKEKFNIKGKYILYLGRIEPHKGCPELFKFFLKYREETGIDLQLVLAGRNDMEKVADTAVIYAGFVSEEEKWQLLTQTEVLAVPSRHESLSLVLLESFASKVPVIASAWCEVLKSHIEKSGGGWAYSDYEGFAGAMNEVVKGNALQSKGNAGFEYVKEHYNWEKVMAAFDETISYIETINQ